MVATKAQPLDKQKTLHFINHFFDVYQNCCNENRQPNAAEFEKIISRDFQHTSNGKLIGRNVQDFLKRIQDVKNKYSHVQFTHINDCLIADHKVAIQYDIHMTPKNDKKFDLTFMVIATFDPDNGHITHWTQVLHEKMKDHLNS